MQKWKSRKMEESKSRKMGKCKNRKCKNENAKIDFSRQNRKMPKFWHFGIFHVEKCRKMIKIEKS
jgi:hypothetical protein